MPGPRLPAGHQLVPVPGPVPVPGVGSLFHSVARDAVSLFFSSFVHLAASADLRVMHEMWTAVNSSTEPVLSGAGWQPEFSVMAVLGALVAVPLLCAAAIQAVVRQDPAGLLRSAFVRLPLAIVFTGAAVALVSLGLGATDQACRAVLSAADPTLGSFIARVNAVLGGATPAALAADLAFVVVAGILALIVWLELAVRSAAVALAVLFLPLALAGSAFPATAHWARRLGETLAALVVSKLAIVSALTLAASTLGAGSGLAALVEAITLLGLAAVAPLALARILPMVGLGAIAHLDGLGRHAVRQAASFASDPNAWIGSAVGRPTAEAKAQKHTPNLVALLLQKHPKQQVLRAYTSLAKLSRFTRPDAKRATR